MEADHPQHLLLLAALGWLLLQDPRSVSLRLRPTVLDPHLHYWLVTLPLPLLLLLLLLE
jgi:hypothetical protein